MSESLSHIRIAEEIINLADLSGAQCSDFQHQIVNSKTAFTSATEANLITYTVPANFAFIMTEVEIKVLYNTADAALVNGDYRSTFDFNPFGPYVGVGAVGTVRFLVDDQQYGASPAYDFAITGHGVILVVLSGRVLKIAANPQTPVGENVTLVTMVNAYLVPQVVGEQLKKNETQIITV